MPIYTKTYIKRERGLEHTLVMINLSYESNCKKQERRGGKQSDILWPKITVIKIL